MLKVGRAKAEEGFGLERTGRPWERRTAAAHHSDMGAMAGELDSDLEGDDGYAGNQRHLAPQHVIPERRLPRCHHLLSSSPDRLLANPIAKFPV